MKNTINSSSTTLESSNTYNVLIMADYRTPCSGNFVASLLELAESMREHGNYVHFLFLEHRNGGGYTWTKWLEQNGFSVTLLNDQTPAEEVLSSLKCLIEKHNIQIIHSHFGLYHKLLVKKKQKLGVKVLFHDHMDFSPEENFQKQKLRALIYSAIYRIKGIHVVSVMELKSKAYCICGKKYNHYVPNGLALRRGDSIEVTREELRTRLGISSNDKLCLLLGYNKYGKGMDIAIKAVEYYRKSDPSLHIGVIGVGCPPYKSTVDWIKKMTNIEVENCEWLHFFPSFEDIFALQRAIDVFLSDSRQEAFSYAVLEAISQNTPIVLSDVPGTQWAAKYNKSVVYPVEDVEACADAMRQALNLGRRPSNQDEIMAQYSIVHWCEKITNIYSNM